MAEHVFGVRNKNGSVMAFMLGTASVSGARPNSPMSSSPALSMLTAFGWSPSTALEKTCTLTRPPVLARTSSAKLLSATVTG